MAHDPDPLPDDHEDYASSEDSDFAPDGGGGDDDDGMLSDSDSESSSQVIPQKRRYPNPSANQHDRAGFDNSGDEAIISKGRKKRKMGNKEGSNANQGGRDGGDAGCQKDNGPLIKTRSMKAIEKAERKAKAVSGPVTVDINALWASMTAAPIIPSSCNHNETNASEIEGPSGGDASRNAEAGRAGGGDADTITIRRAYNFAGRIVAETKTVARDSAEARLYLASKPHHGSREGDEDGNGHGNVDQDPRKIRRTFRSAFEPLSLLAGGAGSSGARSDLNLSMASLLRMREEAAANAAKKLNTVQKSKLDWAAHVDKEGMREELELAGRKRGNFGDTQDFLVRVEGRKEEEARRVRLGGRA